MNAREKVCDYYDKIQNKGNNETEVLERGYLMKDSLVKTKLNKRTGFSIAQPGYQQRYKYIHQIILTTKV